MDLDRYFVLVISSHFDQLFFHKMLSFHQTRIKPFDLSCIAVLAVSLSVVTNLHIFPFQMLIYLFLLYLCYVISFQSLFLFSLEHAGELRVFVLRGNM